MKKLTPISLLLAVSVSCNQLNFQRTNNEKDKIEGETVINAYFENVLSGNREKIIQLCSKELLEHTPKDAILRYDSLVEIKLGKIVSRSLSKWETNIVEGTNAISEYAFIYDVVREKYNSTETFYLIKEPSDSIKIQKHSI